MIRFDSDYTEGACPEILRALTETNFEQTEGYGIDPHCENAKVLLRAWLGKEDAEIHFLVGGTQTNTTVISSLLRPYEGVVACDTAHIAVHETGAIEGTGHKVIALPGRDGKLSAEQVRECFEEFAHSHTPEHEVMPGAVYVSFPTELGTVYTKEELAALHAVCREYHAPLYVDGARLGYGLACPDSGILPSELASLCDVFYVGGTKIGMLFGEAVVIPEAGSIPGFRPMIKHHGGMLAKGRLLGIQFETMFRENGALYGEVSRNAHRQAMKIRRAVTGMGYPEYYRSPTNQQFFVFPDTLLEKLEKDFVFSFTAKTDSSHTAVRICTSWATSDAQVSALIEAIGERK